MSIELFLLLSSGGKCGRVSAVRRGQIQGKETQVEDPGAGAVRSGMDGRFPGMSGRYVQVPPQNAPSDLCDRNSGDLPSSMFPSGRFCLPVSSLNVLSGAVFRPVLSDAGGRRIRRDFLRAAAIPQTQKNTGY